MRYSSGARVAAARAAAPTAIAAGHYLKGGRKGVNVLCQRGKAVALALDRLAGLERDLLCLAREEGWSVALIWN